MTQIDNISLPTERKICNLCNIEKLITEFSLKIGKSSQLRKPFCTKCEQLKRKHRNMKYVAPKWSVLLNLTCSVCNDPSSYVDVTKNDLPKGILCERCHKILQLSVGTDNELLEKLALYKLINEKFPFWQRALIELRSNLKIENETPLLDFDK